MKKTIVIYLSLIGIIIDRITKILVTSNLSLYVKNKIINNFFYITYVQNKGAAWSILNGNRFFLIIITFIALAIIIKYVVEDKSNNKLDIISYGLVLGGIIGNLIDRLFLGYVVDFFDFYIFGYNYPVFNVADILIVVGVILLFISYFRSGKIENNS
ncbi:MAG: signal peptidase II [bacterium]|nr:signal peptidase II [bacterium]